MPLIRNNSSVLIYILLCLILLPSLYIKVGTQLIAVYTIAVIFGLIYVCFFSQNPLNKILSYFHKTPCKYLILFILFAILTILISACLYFFNIGKIINSFIGGLLGAILLPFIFILITVPQIISIKKCIKIIYIFTWGVFLLGVFDFIANSCNIHFLQDFINLFGNRRLLEFNLTSSTVYSYGLPRVKSIFEEPSYLGYFILIISPIVYELTLSKYKIVKHNVLNLFLKKTIIPLMWISLLLTQSPIFLIFNLIFTSIYFINKVIKKNKDLYKWLLFAIFIFSVIFLLISNTEVYSILKNSFLYRIIVVFEYFKDFNTFVAISPSLATRIIAWVNQMIVGIKHFFIGVGYGNLSLHIIKQYTVSPLGLTPELGMYIALDKKTINPFILTKIFAETGIIGTLLYYTFLFKLQSNIRKVLNVLMIDGIEVCFLRAIYLFNFVYIISTIYDSNLQQPYVFVIFALAIILIYKYKYQIIHIKNEVR